MNKRKKNTLRAIIAISLVFITTVGMAQNNRIKAEMALTFKSYIHQPGAKFQLFKVWPSKKVLVDTMRLNSEKELTFNISDTVYTMFELQGKKPFVNQQIILERGLCKIVLNADTQLNVIGNDYQNLLEHYNKTIAPLNKEWQTAGIKYTKAKNLEEKLLAEKESKEIAAKVQTFKLNFIKSQKNNIVGEWVTYSNMFSWRLGELLQLEGLFNGLNTRTPILKEIKSNIASQELTKMVDKMAPLFTLSSIKNDEVSLANEIKKSKYILLDFWASWCTPCRAANRELAPHYKELKKNGLEIISISVDEDLDLWKKAVESDKIPWMQLIVPNAMKSKVVQDYLVKTLPSTFLINSDGIIIEQNISIDSLKKRISAINR